MEGRTINNPNDEGGSHQTRAFSARSPNKEVNRLNQRTDRTANGLNVPSTVKVQDETCEKARPDNKQLKRRWRRSSDESLYSTLT
eukprot:scaffold9418_cov42-Cyclotella_meneghiniana.AAC.1